MVLLKRKYRTAKLILDVLLFSLAAYLSFMIRLMDISPDTALKSAYVTASALAALLTFGLLGTARHAYRHFSLHDFVQLAWIVALALLLTLVISFLWFRLDTIPRAAPLIHGPVAMALLSGVRIFVRYYFGNFSHWQKVKFREPILVIGLNAKTELFLRALEVLGNRRYRVAGILDESTLSQGSRMRSCEVIGKPADLSGILVRFSVHGLHIRNVVLTIPREELGESGRKVLETLEREGMIHVSELDAVFSLMLPEIEDRQQAFFRKMVNRYPVPAGLEDAINERLRRYGPVKRFVDISGALMLSLFGLPVALLITPMIWLTMGRPALFWQERFGKDGRFIRIYKFRTMKPAEGEDGRLLSDAERQHWFGNLLRRTRMDELPQLINVLKGDMSFIGPRPMLPSYHPLDVPEWVRLRTLVRPGILGWAQVHGGQQMPKRDKVILDVWYLRNMSLRLDMLIILKTARMVMLGERLDRRNIFRAYEDLQLSFPPELVGGDEPADERRPAAGMHKEISTSPG